MRRTLLIILATTWWPSMAVAQSTVNWTHTQVSSPASAALLVTRAYVTPLGGTQPTTGVTITGITCVAAPVATNALCTGTLAAPAGNDARLAGAETRLTAQAGTTAETAKGPPFQQPAYVPGAPTVTP